MVDMLENNNINNFRLENKINSNIEINNIIKELKELINNNRGLDSQYYKELLKETKKIKRCYNICSKYGITIIDTILHCNTIYYTHKWDSWKQWSDTPVNNYMVVFLELNFKEKYILSSGGFFNLDDGIFTTKYYYIVDIIISSLFDRDTDLIGMNTIKLNTFLEDKLLQIKKNIGAPNIPISWSSHYSHKELKGVEL